MQLVSRLVLQVPHPVSRDDETHHVSQRVHVLWRSSFRLSRSSTGKQSAPCGCDSLPAAQSTSVGRRILWVNLSHACALSLLQIWPSIPSCHNKAALL